MRLFIAIELAGPAKDEILRIRERLVESVSRQGVRFVKPEKLHLTLAFLGNVDESSLDQLKGALESVQRTEFRLQLSELGCFPDMRRSKVIWIGFGGELDAVRELAAMVTQAAKPLAPELDEKPYSPHITLARVNPGSKEVGRALQNLNLSVEADELPVNAFSLVHSKPDGTYETLHQIAL